MKVKISYTTEIDQIPNEVNRLIDNIEHQLKTCLACLGQVGSQPSVRTVEALDTLRKGLGYTDVMTVDVMAILDGYLRASMSSLDKVDIPGEKENVQEG